MSYVLVTPARNEEAYIEETLKSVVAQEERPDRWIIVSDGSTDCTDAIIEGYAAEHPFIRLMRKEGGTTRDFASCVFTMLMGIEAMQDISYDFVGILDADIRLDASYYRAILKRFHDDPKLGLAGGALYQRFGDRFVDQKIAEDSVAGGVQLFRRECYEDIGGLIPIPNGGWDPVAEVTARMKGWTTQTFGDIPFYHLKPMNSAAGSEMAGRRARLSHRKSSPVRTLPLRIPRQRATLRHQLAVSSCCLCEMLDHADETPHSQRCDCIQATGTARATEETVSARVGQDAALWAPSWVRLQRYSCFLST